MSLRPTRGPARKGALIVRAGAALVGLGLAASPLAADEIPRNAYIFAALADGARQLSAMAGRAVASLEAGECTGRPERALALRSTIGTARQQHEFLLAETRRFEAEPTQQSWQALGQRVISASRALQAQQDRLAAAPGVEGSAEEIYGRIVRSLDWPFVYQDVRRAQAELPSERLAAFRAVLAGEIAQLQELELRLGALAERPCP
jgi:hypothetical protein